MLPHREGELVGTTRKFAALLSAAQGEVGSAALRRLTFGAMRPGLRRPKNSPAQRYRGYLVVCVVVKKAQSVLLLISAILRASCLRRLRRR